MDSDDDVPLSTFLHAPVGPVSHRAQSSKTRGRTPSSPSEEGVGAIDPPLPRKRARNNQYTLDGLGCTGEDQDEYDLGSSVGESDASSSAPEAHSTDSRQKGRKRGRRSSDTSFNYLAFDAARDRVLDEQVGCRSSTRTCAQPSFVATGRFGASLSCAAPRRRSGHLGFRGHGWGLVEGARPARGSGRVSAIPGCRAPAPGE